jgi:hypothetical protein
VANEEGSDGEGNRVSTLGPSITTHRYAKDLEPTRGGKFAEKFWIGFAGTAAFSFEVGVNPVEMIDFIVGLTTIDLMGDDTWAPRPIEAKPAARP